MLRYVNENKIEILVGNTFSAMENFVYSWEPNDDMYFCKEYDFHEQRIYSAYTQHIENIKYESLIIKRLISLNVLINGSIYISQKNIDFFVKFENYNIKENELFESIEKDNRGGFYTDSIEEYPFNKNEEYHLENKNLPQKANLECYLFIISKFDFVVRTLLFQAGLISTSTFSEKIGTWNTIYKMIDTIKLGCEEIGVDFNSIIDNTQLKKFTASCNNPTVLGINSRHGGRGRTVPETKHIKDINEAISIVLNFSFNFIKKYVVSKNYIKINE